MSSSATKSKSSQNIQVYVRARPLNDAERSRASHSVMETTEHTVKLHERPTDRTSKSFSYDRVFGPNSKQVDVYRVVVVPLLEQVLLGYNCTVFAYGQTGTGKTYTMEGERSDETLPWDQDPDMGIIPRTFSHLFDELRIQGVEFTTRVSFLEMYNEELFDLLGPETDTTRLRLFEDSQRKGSCIIHGLEEVTVHNKNDIYDVLRMGSQKRQTAATLMNAHSSRSHTVFSITVHIKESTVDGEELLKTGKLNLVDLAGSENIGRSGAVDRRAREAGNINQSLLTLGRVITALVERGPHVPYRESKLTRLLQDSLGGRTRTSLIAAVSPASCNLEETLSTLDYAQRARNIQNKPELNQKLSKKTLMKEYTEEIERLRRDLMAQREQNGVFLAPENHAHMLSTIEQQGKELIDKVNHIRAVEAETEKVQTLFSETKAELEQKATALKDAEGALCDTRQVLTDTKQILAQTALQRDEQAHLVERRADTELRLAGQASQLLATVSDATADLSAVHDKLARKRSLERHNDDAAEQFRAQYQVDMDRLETSLGSMFQQQAAFCQAMYANLGAAVERRKHESASLSGALAALLGSLTEQLRELESHAQVTAGGAHDWLASQLAGVAARRDQQAEAGAALLRRLTAAIEAGRQWLQRSGASEAAAADAQRRLLTEHWEAAAAADHQLLRLLEAHDRQRHTEEAEQRARLEADNQRLTQLLADSGQELQSLQTALDAMASAVVLGQKAAQKMADIKVETAEALSVTGAARRTALEVMQRAGDAQHADTTQRVQQAGAQRGELAVRVQQLSEQRQQQVSGEWEAAATELELGGAGVTHDLSELNAGWQQHCTLQEEAMRARSETVNSALQHSQQRVQAAAGSLHAAVRGADQLLEAQNGGFFATIGERQSELTDQCNRIKQQAVDAAEAVRSRDNEVQVFVVETLQRDAVTGLTPQRRQFQYPRYLAATSPHQRILQRYRAARRRHARSRHAHHQDEDADTDTDAQDVSLSELAGEMVPLPELSGKELLEISTDVERTPASQTNRPQSAGESVAGSQPRAAGESEAGSQPRQKPGSVPQRLQGAGSLESLPPVASVSDVSDAGSDIENRAPERRQREFAVPATRRLQRRGLRQPKVHGTRQTPREPLLSERNNQ